MRFAKIALTFATSSIVACGGSSSGGGTNPPPPGAVSSVSLNKTSALVKPSESVTLTATPKDANGTTLSGKTVIWTITPTTGTATLAASGSSATITGTADGVAHVKATVDQVASQDAAITVSSTIATSAQVSVGSGGDVFTPDQVDISSGGIVTFNWAAGPHNVTWGSTPASVPNSGDKSTGSFQVTFPQAGTYNYECTVHPGMKGSVTVH
jgi:plastocyanin